MRFVFLFSHCRCFASLGVLLWTLKESCSALGHLSSLSRFNEFRAVNEKLFRSGLKERGSYFPLPGYIVFVSFLFFFGGSACCTGFDVQFVFSRSFSFRALRRDGRAAAAAAPLLL